MSHVRSAVCLVAAFLSWVVPSGGQETDTSIADEITVFEAQVTADLSSLSPREVRRLRPEDLTVLEAGIPRRVTSLRRLRGAGEWRVVLYFDAALSRARTLRLAGLQLGEHAAFLTGLGSVEVIVADPAPRTVYGPDRNDKLLAQILAELQADEAGTDILRSGRRAFRELGDDLPAADPRRRDFLRREEKLVRQQADHLLRLAASGCAGAPCAMFLVQDGYWESPAGHYLGSQRLEHPAGYEPPPAAAAREVAQTLAGYEWVGIAMPIREGEIETKAAGSQGTEFDRFIDATGGVRLLPKAGDRPFVLGLESLEVNVTPQLQPLRKIGEGTVGEVVRVVSQVEGAMAGLEDLWRISYLTDRRLDGVLRTAELRVSTGGGALPTAAWVRSSTPEAIANLRLRELLEGADAPADLDLRVSHSRRGTTAVLGLEADWGRAAELVADRDVRVSVAYASAPGEYWIGHALVGVETLPEDGSWRHEVTIELPDGVRRLAVAVEGLVPRAWGASVIEM